MEELPDILDLIGKTPREFGAHHLHFESVHPVESSRVVASVLFQGAFDPMPRGGTLMFLSAPADAQPPRQIASFALPELPSGCVVRVRYPLVVPECTTSLHLVAEAPAPEDRAIRVRPAWKLFDTFEIPKLSEMEPVYSSAEVDLGTSLFASAALGGVGFAIAYRGSSTRLDGNDKTVVHRARELPPQLTRAVSSEPGSPLEAPEQTVLWSRGDPLPAPASVAPVPLPSRAQARGVRRCVSCAFEGPAAEYERARSCPSCDAPWY